jgi:outer membrane murein-binding lipoprotein Lpp
MAAMRIVLYAAIGVAALALAGCGGRPSEIDAERRQFEKRARVELDSLDVHIAELRARVARLDRRVKAEAEPELRRLERRRSEVRSELAELGRAGSAAWKRAEAAAEKSLAGLDSLWERAQKLAPEP